MIPVSKIIVDTIGVCMELVALYAFAYLVLGKSEKSLQKKVIIMTVTGVLLLLFSLGIADKYLRIVLYTLTVFLPMSLFPGQFLLKIFTIIMMVNIASCSEMLTKVFFVSIEGSQANYDLKSMDYYAIGLFISKCLALGLVYIMLSFKKVPHYPLPSASQAALLILPFTTLVASYQFMAVSYVVDHVILYFSMVMIVFLLILSNVILFYLFEKQIEGNHYKMQAALAQRQRLEQELFYTKLVREKQETNKLTHDLKNCLLALTGYLQNQQITEALAYLNRMQVTLQENYTHVTGLAAVDMILAEKKQRAQESGAILNIHTTLSAPLSIDEMDLALLLANGMDNAIEAVASDLKNGSLAVQSRKQEPPAIEANLSVGEHFIDIILTNPVHHPVHIEHHRIKTTKTDSLHHGLGLLTIEDIVHKYQGNLELRMEDGMFVLDAMLNNKKYEVK